MKLSISKLPKPFKLIGNAYRNLGILAFICASNAVYAAGGGDASWTQKPCEFLNNITAGIKYLGYGVALIMLTVAGIQIFSGSKRAQDCWYWFVGAVIFGAAEPIVKLFFGDNQC